MAVIVRYYPFIDLTDDNNAKHFDIGVLEDVVDMTIDEEQEVHSDDEEIVHEPLQCRFVEMIIYYDDGGLEVCFVNVTIWGSARAWMDRMLEERKDIICFRYVVDPFSFEVYDKNHNCETGYFDEE